MEKRDRSPNAGGLRENDRVRKRGWERREGWKAGRVERAAVRAFCCLHRVDEFSSGKAGGMVEIASATAPGVDLHEARVLENSVVWK